MAEKYDLTHARNAHGCSPQPDLLILPLSTAGRSHFCSFLSTGGGFNFTAPAPVEALTVERTIY